MSFNRRTFFTAVAGAAVGGAVVSLSGSAPSFNRWVDDNRRFSVSDPAVEVFGAVRFPSAGPVILDDANHTPAGLTSVAITSTGFLQINHTDLGEVGYSSADGDEALTGNGIIASAPSQGFTYGRIRFYSASLGRALQLDVAGDYDKIQGDNNNVWFYARSYD